MHHATAYTSIGSISKLELMFMKHYAPNRCLYTKVAKLRTGVGSAEMSHLQNRCLKISVVPMIDYNRKSFIYLQPIIDRLGFWESIIIGKIPKQKNFIFI